MNGDDLEYVNGLIGRFRDGDKDAELKLWERYFPKIRMFAKYNSQCRELKSRDDIAPRLWLILRERFLKSGYYIEAGEGAVIRDLVRGYCRDWLKMEKREPNIDDNPQMTRGDEFNLNWRSALSNLKGPLHECLEELSPAKQELLDLIFFEGLTFKQVRRRLHIKETIINSVCEEALNSLQECLNNKGIFSIEEVLWTAQSSKRTSANMS